MCPIQGDWRDELRALRRRQPPGIRGRTRFATDAPSGIGSTSDGPLPDTGASLATSLRKCEEQGGCPRAMVQQVMTQLRKFSRCMRSHGVPKWPDPVIDAQGKPEVIIKPWLLGVDPDSNQVNTVMDRCRHVEHPQVPTPIEEYLPPSGQSG